MAKTFYTNGTGSQQTLTGSQNEKVAVYQTLADAEADLANLEAGQIVATPDTGDENAQPVDVIQAGNMHAVTSNAVATSNAMPVDSVTLNNVHSVTSNAVAQALSSYSTQEWADSTTKFEFCVVKRNGIVTLTSVPRYDGFYVTSQGSPVYVGTLPNGYKPLTVIRGVAQYGDSDLCAVQIETDGTIKFGTWSTKKILSSIYMSVSFPCT